MDALAMIMSKTSFPERQALVRRIDELHQQGVRLDPKLVARVRDYATPSSKVKSETKVTPSDEPTVEQINRMLRHFGL